MFFVGKGCWPESGEKTESSLLRELQALIQFVEAEFHEEREKAHGQPPGASSVADLCAVTEFALKISVKAARIRHKLQDRRGLEETPAQLLT